jgi:hypothetical protein
MFLCGNIVLLTTRISNVAKLTILTPLSSLYRVLLVKPEGKRPFGRPRRRWENNIKKDLQEMGCGDMKWIDLACDRDSCCECDNESSGSIKC